MLTNEQYLDIADGVEGAGWGLPNSRMAEHQEGNHCDHAADAIRELVSANKALTAGWAVDRAIVEEYIDPANQHLEAMAARIDPLIEHNEGLQARMLELKTQLSREANRSDCWVNVVRNQARLLGVSDAMSNGSIADWETIVMAVKRLCEMDSKTAVAVVCDSRPIGLDGSIAKDVHLIDKSLPNNTCLYVRTNQHG